MGDAHARLVENHRRRHDHTDTTPRCSCGGFLPVDGTGKHNATCGNCRKPTVYWVDK